MRAIRPGIAMVELMVSLFVVAILVGLLLPAVQFARETARKTQCRSNLRQIALATHEYSVAQGAFPPGCAPNGYSALVALLPYLDHESLFARVDYSIGEDDGPTELRTVRVPVFYCPSDGAPTHLPQLQSVAGTNYAGNCGVWHLLRPFDGAFRYWDVAPKPGTGPPLRPSEFVDGLSNTSLFADVPRSDGTYHRLRMVWNLPFAFGPGLAGLASFREMCGGLPSDPKYSGWSGSPIGRGVPWSNGSITLGLYTHTLVPNAPSCYNGTAVRSAAATAGGFHSRGINAAFADGHVDFLSNGIDLETWMALGTRDQGDVAHP